jgi:hypothetical protein
LTKKLAMWMRQIDVDHGWERHQLQNCHQGWDTSTYVGRWIICEIKVHLRRTQPEHLYILCIYYTATNTWTSWMNDSVATKIRHHYYDCGRWENFF